MTLLAAIVLTTAACDPATTTHDDGEQAEVGGVDATAKLFEPVGSLWSRTDPAKPPAYFCSAVLIGPRTVMTAKHCARKTVAKTMRLDAGPVWFRLGHDGTKPTREVLVVSEEISPIDAVDGFAETLDDEGKPHSSISDIAIFHLAEDIDGVAFPAIRTDPVTDADVGQRLFDVSYGIQDMDGARAVRKVGAMTTRAIRGKPLHELFATEEEHIAFYRDRVTSEQLDKMMPTLQHAYPQDLAEGHEVWIGAKASDAEGCAGDSGSPLVTASNGALEVVGIMSFALDNTALASPLRCDGMLGAIMAPTGYPELHEMLEREMADDCRGLTDAGSCLGTQIAVRCTRPNESTTRRVVVTDCSALGLACAEGTDGVQVACVDAPAP